MKHHVYAALFISMCSTYLLGMNNGKQPLSTSDNISLRTKRTNVLSASIPATDSAATSLPSIRTRILKPVYRFTSGKPNFYFTQHDVKPGEQPPAHSIKIHTPRGNVFYVETKGPTTGLLSTDHKLWHLLLPGFLDDLVLLAKGFLRDARGVAYTGIQNCNEFCAGGKVLIARFVGGHHRLFNAESGQEIEQGAEFPDITSYTSNGTLVSKDRCRLFDLDGREMESPVGYKFSLWIHNCICLHTNDNKILLFNQINDPVKKFGGLFWEKVLFLIMAKHGLLQKNFVIALGDRKFLESIYTSIPEHTRRILQQPPYNLPNSFLDKRDDTHDLEMSRELTSWSSCALI